MLRSQLVRITYNYTQISHCIPCKFLLYVRNAKKKKKKKKRKKKRKKVYKKYSVFNITKWPTQQNCKKKNLFAEDCVFINLPVNVIVSLLHRRSGDKHFYHPLMTNKSTIMT